LKVRQKKGSPKKKEPSWKNPQTLRNVPRLITREKEFWKRKGKNGEKKLGRICPGETSGPSLKIILPDGAFRSKTPFWTPAGKKVDMVVNKSKRPRCYS